MAPINTRLTGYPTQVTATPSQSVSEASTEKVETQQKPAVQKKTAAEYSASVAPTTTGSTTGDTTVTPTSSGVNVSASPSASGTLEKLEATQADYICLPGISSCGGKYYTDDGHQLTMKEVNELLILHDEVEAARNNEKIAGDAWRKERDNRDALLDKINDPNISADDKRKYEEEWQKREQTEAELGNDYWNKTQARKNTQDNYKNALNRINNPTPTDTTVPTDTMTPSDIPVEE